MEINYSGYNVNNGNHASIYRPRGSADYLLLLFLTPFFVRFDNAEILAKPNAFIIYSPGYPQNYQAQDVFRNSYVHFCEAEDMICEYYLPLNHVFYMENHVKMNQILKEISIEYVQKSIYYKKKLDALLHQLFIDISRQTHNEASNAYGQTLYNKFQRIRADLLSYCENDWTTEKICQLAEMEKSQLYSYYQFYFFTSPKADIIHARIDKAKILLTNEACRVKEVAEMCGFKNISHFSRYFKKATGIPPGEYYRSSRP